MSTVDFTRALHAASLYVEDLKYGNGPRTIETLTNEDAVRQIEKLKEDSNFCFNIYFDTAELVEDTAYYGDSFARLGVNPIVARSIFLDGIMHGLAVAAGLRK